MQTDWSEIEERVALAFGAPGYAKAAGSLTYADFDAGPCRELVNPARRYTVVAPTGNRAARRRQAAKAHAAHVAADVMADGAASYPLARPSRLMGGLPTIEIQGPDGEWRRYYVRLTEVTARVA